MKQVVSKYLFSPGAAGAGTVTLLDLTSVDLGRLLMIVNTTRNVVIYNLADPNRGATVAGNVVTLGYTTATHSSGDKLSVFYDIQRDDPDYNKATHTNSFTNTLRDDFNATLDPTKWLVTATGTGATQGITTSQLRLLSGTNANATIKVRSVKAFRLPMRVQFSVVLQSRIANVTQGVQIRNTAGDTYANIEFPNGSSASLTYNTQNRGTNSGATTVTGVPGTANLTAYEIDINSEYIEFFQRGLIENTAATTATMGMRQRHLLEPGEDYYLEFYSINGSTAPASTQYIGIDHVVLQEFHRTEVEVYGARTSSNYNRLLPVVIPQGASLNGANAHIGSTSADGVNYDSTNTALAANGTFTGTSRDLTGVISSGGFSSTFSGQGQKEYRISAAADVAGTLYLEVSRDLGTTWRRIKSVALAAASGTGTVFYGEIIHRPSWRNARLVFVNGATAQTFFTANEILVGS